MTYINCHVIVKTLRDWLNQVFESGWKKVVLQMRYEIYFYLEQRWFKS